MGAKNSQYASPLVQDTSRGPSNSIWASCPIDDLKINGGGGLGTNGYIFEEEFMGGPGVNTTNATGVYTGDKSWGTWIDTGNKIGQTADTTNLPLEGGVLASLPNSTVQSILAAVGGGGFGFVNASSSTGVFRGKMWFEASIAISSIAANSSGLFLGLVDNTSSVAGAANRLLATTAANGLIGTNGFFGFYKPPVSGFTESATYSSGANVGTASTNSGALTGTLVNDFMLAYCVGGGTIQFPGSASNFYTMLTNGGVNSGGVAQGLSAATFTNGAITTPSTMRVKLGWIFDPSPGLAGDSSPAAVTGQQVVGTLYKPTIQFFVNGQAFASFLVPTDIQNSKFPSTWMSPVFGHIWGSSGAGTAYVDFIRVAQIGVS